MGKSKMPPVPPEQRSGKGAAVPDNEKQSDVAGAVNKADRNLEQQGRQGNIKQNTTHQGYQQDR